MVSFASSNYFMSISLAMSMVLATEPLSVCAAKETFILLCFHLMWRTLNVLPVLSPMS